MLAIQDAQSLAILPIASLVACSMQHKKISLFLMQWITGLTVILAACQFALWIWLNCYPQPPENYYHYIKLIFNTVDSVFIFLQEPISGDHVRVFWISSIWITVAVFITPLIINSNKKIFLVDLILGCAICVTFTKGLWLGIFVAIIFCIGVMLFFIRRYTSFSESPINNWWYGLLGLVCSIFLIMFLDYLVNERISLLSRMSIFEITDASNKDMPINNVITDKSTAERMSQTGALLTKWEQRPFMGFGYGAFVSDHVRDPSRPFLYEMLPFALLMKLGIVGFGLYLISIWGLILSVLYKKRGSYEGVMFIGTVIAFFIAANTNPILYSFVGMTVVFFILIWWIEMMHAAGKVPDNQDRSVP
ncbi:O-antigen ligase-like membrane protein [Herminiimonas fonticola]|uniref:O-antigen ligase-like membrane protein n=2 Tax=Herminiimonas fonticola TaxID=303380 RepID=A0A4V3BV77_9BURK|nr:O-antigen ligase like membrane protein [Herminiimonas fonticola]TDN90018.1 O-antigen ligase-like membrane protein [Herminiimonas fonticola]